MDLRNVFTGSAIALVAVIACMSWIASLNQSYGTDAGTTFNNTLSSVQTTLGDNLQTVSIETGTNTQAQPGPAETTQQAGLISRSISTFQQVTSFFTIIPNLLQDAASILGIPQPYAAIAGWTFVFALAITVALVFMTLAGRFA